MTNDYQGPVQPVQIQPPMQPVRPHRGGLILALGILGIVCCAVCGIIAWVMGNGDLREMKAGRMDPSGQGLTQAGKICGIIGLILQASFILLYALMIAIFAATAASQM